MHRIRLITASLAALLFSAVTFVTAAPASFAMRVVMPEGGPSSTTTTIVKSQGMAGWEIALIALAAAALAVALTVAVMRLRSRPSAARRGSLTGPGVQTPRSPVEQTI